MDYQLHQRRLIPRLATTLAAGFAHEKLLAKLDDVFSGADDSDQNRQELETLAAAIKPVATWHALDTLQEAREACGGAGFMAENRFTSLRSDLDVYVTFEGDNNVLLQLVAKRLLSDYAAEFKNADAGALSRYVATQAQSTVLHRFGLRRAFQSVQDTGDERRSANWFKQPDVQRDLLTDACGRWSSTPPGSCAAWRRSPQPNRPRPSTSTSTRSSTPPRPMRTCCSGRPSPRRWRRSRTPGP